MCVGLLQGFFFGLAQDAILGVAYVPPPSSKAFPCAQDSLRPPSVHMLCGCVGV